MLVVGMLVSIPNLLVVKFALSCIVLPFMAHLSNHHNSRKSSIPEGSEKLHKIILINASHRLSIISSYL